jgi:ABC-type phosphate transport system auxiliary subunit
VVVAGVVRFLFALLLGLLLGAGGTLYLMHSGAGDFVIRRTEVVQDLERRLHDVEQQRDQLGRQLDDVIGRAGRMESSFGELERRFRELQQQLDAPHTGAARPAE